MPMKQDGNLSDLQVRVARAVEHYWTTRAGQKGKQKEAEDLATSEFMSVPLRQEMYQPLGDLRVHVEGHDTPADYRRALDLDGAVSTTAYRAAGASFERTAFSSRPDQVIVERLIADRPGRIGFTARFQ